jgi:hypothetical protein
MRYLLIIAAILMTVSAQAQSWRHGAPSYPHFAPGRSWGYAPPYFRQAPAMPYYPPPPQAPAYAPVYRPPAYAPAYPPPPAYAPAPRLYPPPVIVPVAPPVPIVPVQPAPVFAAPVERAVPDVPVRPAARVAPEMTETRNAREESAASAPLFGLPLKPVAAVAGIGALAWYGRRRMKGAGAPKHGDDFAELPY